MTRGLSTVRLSGTTAEISTDDPHVNAPNAPARLAGYRRLIWIALTVLGLVPWLVYLVASPIAIDAHAYFVGDYGGSWGTADAFVYSPAFSQAVEPLRWFGWDTFRVTWRALEVAALALLAGPLTGALLFVKPVALEVDLGNINLLVGAAIVAGFRFPAAWAFILLTKVTPGVGLLWFAVRREWRNLGTALGATAVLAVVSFAYAPSEWIAWVGGVANPGAGPDPIITAPLWLRLVVAGALVTWGALTERRWTVLVGSFLALPSIGLVALAMLVGLWRLREPRPGHAERT